MAGILSRETASSVLGALSITSWLGAQMPQILKNWTLQSAAGLSLPFLVNWMLGDLANLIGCLLTRQLPFQTLLAAYFCLVDLFLVGQYVYYARMNPVTPLPPLSAAYPHVHPHRPARLRASRSESWASERRSSRGGKRIRKSMDRSASRSRGGKAPSTNEEEDPMERSWMSESSSVARSPTRPLSSLPRQYPIAGPSNYNSRSEPSSPRGLERGRTFARPPTVPRQSVVVFEGLETIAGSPNSRSPGPTERTAAFDMNSSQEIEWAAPESHRLVRTPSGSRSRPPSTVRRKSIIFLSVGLLFTFGKVKTARGEAGKVWSGQNLEVVPFAPAGEVASWRGIRHPASWTSSVGINTIPTLRSGISKRGITSDDFPQIKFSQKAAWEEGGEEPAVDWRRFIGRASAWLCCTLYLTSRLPQIWQNFRRRSVEGLSILLFVFAFVGNSLYVASVLINPAASTPGYLVEATPYLLGSGGTLCFDICLCIQILIYSRPNISELKRRKGSRHLYPEDEEEATLLGSEDVLDEGTEGETPSTTRQASGSRRPRENVAVSGGPGAGGFRSSRRPPSSSRSNSTELLDQYSEAVDRNFPGMGDEEDRVGGGGGHNRLIRGGTRSEGPSRSRTRPPSVIDSIAEEGESTLTVRETG